MTIREIMESTADMLTPADISEILGSSPGTLVETVKQDPDALKYLQPIRTGNRVKFPRARFLGWYFGDAGMPSSGHAPSSGPSGHLPTSADGGRL